ncbi:vomeronasal type-2 receptor 26-like [Pleurodeles waltl]|uniref:vomeronasal type-2 receptor 26-like n=1 Tax=Pleurodeles waltl TaxID=8319 RepID=UPI003709A8E9
MLAFRNQTAHFRALAQENLEASQADMKWRYNQKGTLVEFQPEQKVWVMKPVEPRALQDKWTGPFEVVERKSEVTYLVDLRTPRNHLRFLHVVFLKPHFERTELSMLLATDDNVEEDSEPLLYLLSAGEKDGSVEGIPKSSCSEMCALGFRKSTREGQGVCCYDCIPCSDGEISNQTDSPDCIKCLDDQWSNEEHDHCVPKTIEFLSFQEPLGYILVIVATASALTPIVILVIFFKHRETPVVKANNRTLSCLLLVALSLCLLSTFLFLGHPTDTTCMLRQVTFSILFVMCVSCLLAKTALVLMAFEATYPNTTLRSGFGPKMPAMIVFICTLVQSLICVFWLASSPPHAHRNAKSLIGKVVIECNEGSPQAFWCVLGYMGLLALASFLVAFKARKLPDSFNEAQLITFSMLTFLTVWTLFLPTYLNTKGKYMVAVEVFTIICSSMGIVVCIFLPKCYIILIRPDLNNRSHMKGKLSH